MKECLSWMLYTVRQKAGVAFFREFWYCYSPMENWGL